MGTGHNLSMNLKTRFKIFISHASLDRRLANALKTCLCEALTLEHKLVFCSSDSESLKTGLMDNAQIVGALQKASVVVALMTPNSVFRPWVISELGAAHFDAGKRFHILTANGITPECLPAPFNLWHIGTLTKAADIETLCEELGRTLARPAKSHSESISTVVSLASPGAHANWKHVKPVLAVEKDSGSPFCLSEILQGDSVFAAKSRVDIFTRDWGRLLLDFDRHSPAPIIRWLRTEPSRKFRITFSEGAMDAATARGNLEKWMANGPLGNGSTLKARITRQVPQDVVFVDPKEAHGYAVLSSPNYNNIASECPQFIIRRADGHMFDYYWASYHDHMLNSAQCRVIYQS